MAVTNAPPLRGVAAGKGLVDERQDLVRRRGFARGEVGDGVDDGHEHRGGGAVPGDVGDERAAEVVAQIKEVVVVAARAGAGLVVDGHVDRFERGRDAGQQGHLHVLHAAHLGVEGVEGFFQFARQDEVLGGAAEEDALEDKVGEALFVERSGLGRRVNDDVHCFAVFKVRDHDEAARVLKILVRGVAAGGLKVVMDDGLARVHPLRQDAALHRREFVGGAPRVGLARPARGAGDAHGGPCKAAPGEAQDVPGCDGAAHPRGVGANHFLRVGLGAHLAHGVHDVLDTPLPGHAEEVLQGEVAEEGVRGCRGLGWAGCHAGPSRYLAGSRLHLLPRRRRAGVPTHPIFIARMTAAPMSAGLRATSTPAAWRALILESAVSSAPPMMAPAWPMRRPGGAVLPAMNAATGFLTLALMYCGRLDLVGAADLADHEDGVGVGVGVEHADALDVVDAADGVAADADAGALGDAALAGLPDGLVGERAGAADDADGSCRAWTRLMWVWM